MIISTFFPVAELGIISYFFMVEKYRIVSMYSIVYIHSSVFSTISLSPRLGCCTLWAKIVGVSCEFFYFLWIYAQAWDFQVLKYFYVVFQMTLHTVIPTEWTYVCCDQQCRRVSLSLHPLQHLFFSK